MDLLHDLGMIPKMMDGDELYLNSSGIMVLLHLPILKLPLFFFFGMAMPKTSESTEQIGVRDENKSLIQGNKKTKRQTLKNYSNNRVDGTKSAMPQNVCLSWKDERGVSVGFCNHFEDEKTTHNS